MELPREEQHGEGLARPLGVPHHAAASLAVRPCCGDGGGQRLPHRVELVVACELLGLHDAVDDLEGYVVGHEVEEAIGGERASDHHLQFGALHVVEGRAVDRAPGCKAVEACRQGADARLGAVADDHRLVEAQQLGRLGIVVADLGVRPLQGGLGVSRALQLQERERQAVHEDHHVGTDHVALVGPLDDELVGDEEAIGLGVGAVDQVDGDRARLAVAHDLDGNARHEEGVKGAVVLDHVLGRGGEDGADGRVDHVGRGVRVDGGQRAAQLGLQDSLPVARARAHRAVRGERVARDRTPAGQLEPRQGGQLHGLLPEARRLGLGRAREGHAASSAPSRPTA